MGPIGPFFSTTTFILESTLCQSGWKYHSGSCYFYNRNYLNNADASAWCASHDATLINIHDQKDLYFALSLHGFRSSFWVII